MEAMISLNEIKEAIGVNEKPDEFNVNHRLLRREEESVLI